MMNQTELEGQSEVFILGSDKQGILYESPKECHDSSKEIERTGRATPLDRQGQHR